jgi:RNA polymerase sigma-70 factor (ECF subfamily)
MLSAPIRDRTRPDQADDGTSRTLSERLAAMRPRLHRYCARMTGSVIDGEDVLQDALLRAFEAGSDGRTFENLDGWIFRIAHRAALDHLRRRARREARVSSKDVTELRDPGATADVRVAVQANLAAFMRLPISQRSSVVLVDVLGHSVEEVAIITASSVAAVKATLHRGRARLRDLAAAPDEATLLSAEDRRLLRAYADHLNARDFDALRDLLAEQVRLEVVGRATLSGRAAVTTTYFGNYRQTNDWLCVPGVIEGRPGILVHDVLDPLGRPRYFILTEWQQGLLIAARDFRHAAYAAESAAMSPLVQDESLAETNAGIAGLLHFEPRMR